MTQQREECFHIRLREALKLSLKLLDYVVECPTSFERRATHAASLNRPRDRIKVRGSVWLHELKSDFRSIKPVWSALNYTRL